MSQELVRVSHDDREATATQLRRYLGAGYLTIEEFSDRVGLAYAARTRADLVLVVDGLPQLHDAVEIPQPAAPVRRGSRWSVGIFSGFNRRGRWRIDASHRILTIFGGGKLDLRQAEFVAPTTEIVCLTIFGGVTVVVPPEVEIDLSGISIFGARSSRSKALPPPGARRVELKAIAIFGGVNAITKS